MTRSSSSDRRVDGDINDGVSEGEVSENGSTGKSWPAIIEKFNTRLFVSVEAKKRRVQKSRPQLLMKVEAG